MRALWMLAVLLVGHLRNSRKKGSHNEKSHGTRAGFGADGPKAFRRRQADKGRKVAMAKRKNDAAKDKKPSAKDEKEKRFRPRRLFGEKDAPGAASAMDMADKAERFLVDEFPDHPNKWSGDLTVITPAQMKANGQGSFLGVKRWHCEIGINTEAAGSLLRRAPVILHEMLHGSSPGDRERDKRDYPKLRGYEEAPVEFLTRILMPDFAEKNDIPFNDEQYAEWNENHPYNLYIDPLDNLRDEFELGDEDEFWRGLYSVPLGDRPQWLYDRGADKADAGEFDIDDWEDAYEAVNRTLRGQD